MKPSQLFHLQLLPSYSNSLVFQLLGTCINDTLSISSQQGNVTIDLRPIISANIQLPSPDVVVYVNITVCHITTPQEYQVFQALQSNDIHAALVLFEHHIGINSVDEWEQTPLMIR